ncbi:hypothetical protein OROHE_017166 [Orobanche hederae]
MERRRRTGGERGGRGMEENTMAILDTSGFSNSKISHHLDDDRASCFSGSSENLFFPIMEVHLRGYKRFSRVYLSKQEQADSSSPSKVIPQVIMVEEAWVPFNLGLDSYNEKGAATNHSGSSIDSSRFHALIHEIAEVFKGTKSEGNETTFLKEHVAASISLFVLEGDFIPCNCAYHESMNWTLLRESLLHMLLKNGKETINSSSIQFVTIGERGVVRIWNSDGAVLLFEQKSSDLAVSSKKEEVKRGFTFAMMLPLGQGILCG